MTGVLPPMIGSAAVLGEQDTPRARVGDLATSHEAADTNDVTKSIGLVLSILREATEPLTDQQIEFQAVVVRHETFTGQRLRTARRALERLGLVEKDDRIGRTSGGRRASTWRVAAKATEAREVAA